MKIADKFAYVTGMLHKYGVRGLVTKVRETGCDSISREYRKNWNGYMVTQEEWERQRKTVFSYMPLISVVVPAFETPEPFLRALVGSVQDQSYENWELCIADGSSSGRVRECLKQCAGEDSRIRYQYLGRNEGISGNTNAGFAMAGGEFIGLLDHDDMLARNALFEVVRTINENPGCRLLYSDEDKIDASGTEHSRPHFKLPYNRELLFHYNYFCHFLVMEKTLLEEAGRLRPGYDGSQDYDLVLRLVEQAEKTQQKICHIDKILYHWRLHAASTAANSFSKDYAYEAGRRALAECLKSRGISAAVKAVRGGGYYEIAYPPPEEGERFEELCPSDFLDTEAWNQRIADTSAQYILIADRHCTGSLAQREKQRLFGLCRQRKIGIVGVRFAKRGKLVFPEEHKGIPVSWKGYFYRAVLPQNTAYVPLSLCMVRKEAYFAAGGIFLERDWHRQAAEFGKRMQNAGYEVVLDAGVTAEVRIWFQLQQ